MGTCLYDAFEIMLPRYRMHGREYALDQHESAYSDARFEVSQTVNSVREDVVRVRRIWRNMSDSEQHMQPILEVRSRFKPSHYVLPCISMNGNEWGAGGEPKGLERDGKPWIFAGERQGIPACTLTEDAEHVLALFASDADEASLRASCSLMRLADGTYAHRILYPFIEEPLTYSARDEYAPPLEECVALKPGETFAAEAYIYCDRPRWKCFGMAGLEDAALELLDHSVHEPLDDAELWQRSIAFAKSLMLDIDGHKLFSIGFSPENGAFKAIPHFEFGWCGQNGMYARMLIRDYIKGGPKAHLDMALDVLDAWANARGASGLPHVHYERMLSGGAPADLCNLGFYAWEMLRSYHMLKDIGIARPSYIEAARDVCDFFKEHFSEEYGFGKSWDVDTGCVCDMGGTIGAYMIPALVQLHSDMPDNGYLELDMRAYDFYFERDLKNFACTAGALDTVCIDKETSGPMIIGAIVLYEQTRDSIWLERAEMAAYYFSAWMYYYNARYPESSDFSAHDYRTAGGTAVSTQHHHIDPWGAFIAPWLERLAKLTGDARWSERARLMWANACQCVSGEKTVMHGMLRPVGSQNEAYYQCRWHTESAGTINDWLVAWPGAYRLCGICEHETGASFS